MARRGRGIRETWSRRLEPVLNVVELEKLEVDRWNLQNYMPVVDTSENDKYKQ